MPEPQHRVNSLLVSSLLGDPGGFPPRSRSPSLLAEFGDDVLVREDSRGNPDYSDPEFCPVLWEDRL